MARNRFSTGLTIALFAGLFVNGLALGSAKLSGRVTDKKGHAIDGVTVKADRVNRSGSWETKTDANGYYELMIDTPVEEMTSPSPKEFSLSLNYPNPFNPTTCFEYSVSKPVMVRIDVYDILGRLVRCLNEGFKQPGTYEVQWDGLNESGTSIPAGIYLAHMQAGSFQTVRKWVKNDGAATYFSGNFEATQTLEKNLSPESTLGGPDIYNISFTKDNASIETVSNYTIQPSETQKVLNMTMNLAPVIQMTGGIVSTPNATVILNTGAQISDPDDDLESLVISSGEGDVATEITGIEQNSKLQIKLTENFIGKKNLAIKVSDGRSEVQQKFDVTTEGKSFTTQAVNWETGAPITDTMHIIAENLDRSDPAYYHAISTNGNLVLHVKPGTYNVYVRDELEQFDIEPGKDLDTKERFEKNKNEYTKIGKWYDRRLENIDITENREYQAQMMIGEEFDLTWHDEFAYPSTSFGETLAKFDYPSFFFMVEGYHKFIWSPDINPFDNPYPFPYIYTGQNDPELKVQGPIWDKILRGEKLIVLRQQGNALRQLSPYRNETINTHAVETYMKAEEDILNELNPDWFAIQLDNRSPIPDINYDFDDSPERWDSYLEGEAGSSKRGNANTIVNIKLPSNILKDFDYPSQEGENRVRKYIMSNVMTVMGLPGKFEDWYPYGGAYTNFPGVMRAADRTLPPGGYLTYYMLTPSTWAPRDKAAILYYYKTNDRDFTHVLVD